MTTNAMRPSYRNPPLVEALCELVFDAGEWDDTIPGRLYDRISEDYPRKRTLLVSAADITLTPEETRTGVRRLGSRVQFLSPDEKQIVQVERNLLVVNQRAPYPQRGFETWEPVVHRMLRHYEELCAPQVIQRLGVRYLNRITVPKTEFQLEEYFGIYPQLPPDSPGPQSDFLMRVQMHEPDPQRRLLATFSSTPAPKGNASFVLDLYFLSDVRLDRPFLNLPAELARAHKSIQQMFEKCITNQSRRLFGWDGPL